MKSRRKGTTWEEKRETPAQLLPAFSAFHDLKTPWSPTPSLSLQKLTQRPPIFNFLQHRTGQKAHSFICKFIHQIGDLRIVGTKPLALDLPTLPSRCLFNSSTIIKDFLFLKKKKNLQLSILCITVQLFFFLFPTIHAFWI